MRRVVFYLFTLIYLVFCPVLIMYALGYIYQPGEHQGIVKTGLIYLSTAPSGASIYLGSSRFTKKTPAVLPDLLPGLYPVRLTLKKYRTWSEVLPIEKGKATVLEQILFVPEALEQKQLLDGSFSDLIPLNGTRYFLVSKGNTLRDLYVYDWKDEKIWPLVPSRSPFSGAKWNHPVLVDKSPALFLEIRTDDQKRYLWVVLKGRGESEMRDVTDLLPEEVENVQCDPQEKKHLFFLSGHTLNRLTVNSREPYSVVLENVRSYGLFEKEIYLLKSDHSFTLMDLEGKKEKQLLRDPGLGEALFGDGRKYAVRIYSDDMIFFWSSDGELLSNHLPYRLIKEGVLEARYHSKTKRLLVWKDDAIGVLDFSKERDEKSVFESGPKLVWVFRKGKNIKQAYWVYEGSHIVFRDENEVFLLELETYGKPHLYPLLEVKPKSSVAYLEETGKLYILKRSTGELSEAELVPKLEILQLPFPERREETKKSEIVEL
ncbi:MAG TPA: PEGA domain-containing protein [Candidatus Omnitrophota bacterium]|nr:PEGA domain-containing protein [Candidatus Omnitrophota bacterium]